MRPVGGSGADVGDGLGAGSGGEPGNDDGVGRQGGDGRGPGRAHDRNPRGSLVVQEQIESRLTHNGMAVLGDVMRRMANNPDLRQILPGGLEDEVNEGSSFPQRLSPRAARRAERGTPGHGNRAAGGKEDLVTAGWRRTAVSADAAGAEAVATGTGTALTVTRRTAGTGACRGAKAPR